MPKNDTRANIFLFIELNHRVSPKELVEHLKISPQALYRHIKKLLIENKIEKIGSSPKVYYQIAKINTKAIQCEQVDEVSLKFINSNFYTVTPLGIEKEGIEGFKYWCEKRNYPLQKTANEYLVTLGKYEEYKQNSVIDGMVKIKNTFDKVWMDKILYIDFYAIERFGKTKLGYMLLYAKQSQSQDYINRLIDLISDPIKNIIETYDIDGIAFAPPTVKREVQLMKILEKNLEYGLRKVSIEKLKTPIIVPQKTLSKLEDRIENAKNTMLVTENRIFKNILLIDDAVGSGATLNEISAQIKKKNICNSLICLAITGSFNGFDVISEV
jgi:hypothetical protein